MAGVVGFAAYEKFGEGIVLVGLALGAALGMAGTFVAADNVRAVLWAD